MTSIYGRDGSGGFHAPPPCHTHCHPAQFPPRACRLIKIIKFLGTAFLKNAAFFEALNGFSGGLVYTARHYTSNGQMVRVTEISTRLDQTWFACTNPTTHEPDRKGSSYYRIQGSHLLPLIWIFLLVRPEICRLFLISNEVPRPNHMDYFLNAKTPPLRGGFLFRIIMLCLVAGAGFEPAAFRL